MLDAWVEVCSCASDVIGARKRVGHVLAKHLEVGGVLADGEPKAASSLSRVKTARLNELTGANSVWGFVPRIMGLGHSYG